MESNHHIYSKLIGPRKKSQILYKIGQDISKGFNDLNNKKKNTDF
jgi:superoxide dismutase